MVRRLKLADLEKYGFAVSNRYRKYYNNNSKKFLARESVAEALAKARSYLPEGHNFLIWDGKRSLNSQKNVAKVVEKNYPKNYVEMMNQFAGGYSSLTDKLPMNTHRQGGALDLTVIDEKGNELNMGGATWTPRSHLNFFKRKKRLSKNDRLVRNNRLLLEKAMGKAGFKPYLPEWWHWGFCR